MQAPNRVLTGINDTQLVGQYVEWNNQTEISGWGTPTARMINGTGGFLFHPGVTREENLTVFVDELYRLVCLNIGKFRKRKQFLSTQCCIYCTKI